MALRDLGYNIRHEEDCKTRIKMGFKDLLLDKKDKVTGRWTRVKVDFELPPVELNKLVEKEDLGSSSPGRTDQDRRSKRDRESSGSTGSSTPKMLRTENISNNSALKKAQDEKNPHEESFETRLRKADLVSVGASPLVDETGIQNKTDIGSVVSVISTPLISSVNTHTASPVFKKNSTSKI